MNPWGYKKYLNSVQSDMQMGINDMGFNSYQAFGFAHNELSVRLEEYPNERILALTALAICLSAHDGLSEFGGDDHFMSELKQVSADKNVVNTIILNTEDRDLFISDLNRIRSILGL